MLAIEVAYALPDKQRIVALDVEPDCTVLAAAQRSGIAREFPEIDWRNAVLGIFGRVVAQPEQTVVRAGDRIEIYRPLKIDPKAVRRARAAGSKR